MSALTLSEQKSHEILVTVVMPVHNAEKWLDAALKSVLDQSWKDSLQVSIYNDASTDCSEDLITKWKEVLEKNSIEVIIGHNRNFFPVGVGHAKNEAIKQSTGKYICFFDADDIMLPKRLQLQLNAAVSAEWNTIVGSYFQRIPNDSTPRYTDWHNGLNAQQRYSQIYTSFGPTIIQPTWFCSRELIESLGFFDEVDKGHPEDLTFFYKHLKTNGRIHCVEETLLLYRYHQTAATFSVHEDTIWDIRMRFLEVEVLHAWSEFTIWNAGKQGRRFYRSLRGEDRRKVKAFCDVDEKKIAKGEYRCELLKDGKDVPTVPIIHFRDASPPFVICVKINLTKGEFEQNLASLNLKEGKDYILFS